MSIYVALSGKIYTAADTPFTSEDGSDLYTVVEDGDVVAAIYKPDTRTAEKEQKLLAMTALRFPDMKQYAWPLDVVYEPTQWTFAGYVMPKATGKENVSTIFDTCAGKPWSFFVTIAKNTARAVRDLHKEGQIIGRLHAGQILVDPDTRRITVTGADSFHITDKTGNVFPCESHAATISTPELQGEQKAWEPLPVCTKEQDDAALATLIFRLLMNGAHPSISPTDITVDIPAYAPLFASLPAEIHTLFRGAFIEGRTEPAETPSGDAWYAALERLLNGLTLCVNRTNHYYAGGAAACPWCTIEKNGRLPRQKEPVPALPSSQPHVQQPCDDAAVRISKGIAALLITALITAVIVCIVYAVKWYGKGDLLYAEIAEKESALYALQSRLRDAEAELTAVRAQLSDAETELTGIRTQVSTLRDDLENANAQLDTTQRELADATNTANRFLATYPAFSITRIRVFNQGDNPGDAIISSRSTYLYTEIRYESFLSSARTYELYIKIFHPNGALSTGTSSPDGYSFSSSFYINAGSGTERTTGWGGATPGHWRRGTYRIELWYKNSRMAESTFTIQ
ncbi:MAG: hypothetical protein LBP19_08140 [Treponema sp.]|jgi:hypothetical protein|nr:hypothetical protein [Treponema sp.]